jgi:monoamine oxidase
MYCGGSSSSSAEEAQVFQPVHYVERDWCTDEHSNGAYADVFPPGLLTHPSVRGELRGPFRRVHFAGTETATAFYGYMEGAARAGRRAAAEVIEAMRLEATQM